MVIALVIFVVRNPGDAPLMVGFTARRRWIPGWLDSGMSVSAPRRTTRRRFRAERHDVVGIVPARRDARFAVPVRRLLLPALPLPPALLPALPPAAPRFLARRFALTAVIGQSARLRVFRIPVTDQDLPDPGDAVFACPSVDDGRLT